MILKNPCNGFKPGGTKAKEKTPLTREQQVQLVDAAKDEYLELFVLLCLYAGLRREEALGLCWEHIHLDSTPYLDVRATLTCIGNSDGLHSPNLKSPSARRSIPLPPVLAQALRLVRPVDGKGYVITAKKSNNWLPYATFRRNWKTICDKVDFKVHPHLLRHTYITELCASGLDIRKIQYLAGHSNPQMTLKVYTHVTQNKPHELISAIEGAFPAPKLGGNFGVK